MSKTEDWQGWECGSSWQAPWMDQKHMVVLTLEFWQWMWKESDPYKIVKVEDTDFNFAFVLWQSSYTDLKLCVFFTDVIGINSQEKSLDWL